MLSPILRGENNYRYYSVRQLAICNTIRILQKLGLPLAEIKSLMEHRTPELASDILVRQIGEFGEMQGRIYRALILLHTTLKAIRSGLNIDEGAITVQRLPSERIVIGPQNDYSSGRTDYDALYAFYQAISERFPLSEYDTCYPVWGIMSKERVKKRDWGYPDRYYFFNPNGCDQRPAGTYAVGYMRGGYGHGLSLYERMVDYIVKNGFEICGDAYEEYPLNEISITDDSNYLLRILIAVREKSNGV